MTPKEKAKELVEKIFLILSKRGEHHYTFDYSKECALIAVYEIIDTLNQTTLEFEYWEEIKSEIEKL